MNYVVKNPTCVSEYPPSLMGELDFKLNKYRSDIESINKEETSYDDLLDALRFNLKGYQIE